MILQSDWCCQHSGNIHRMLAASSPDVISSVHIAAVPFLHSSLLPSPHSFTCLVAHSLLLPPPSFSLPLIFSLSFPSLNLFVPLSTFFHLPDPSSLPLPPSQLPHGPDPSFFEKWESTLAKRRTTIPPKPSHRLNLWTIMKNCIGRDLSKIPMPVCV